MDIETRRKISRTMKGKSNFEGKKHTHATKIEIGFSQEGHRNTKDHKWVTDKETGKEHRVKGNIPKGMRRGRTPAFSQWIHTKENFIDGRNPEDKGDMARHGLKNKNITQLKKIRGSDTASPRQKQLAHWYINMRIEEAIVERKSVICPKCKTKHMHLQDGGTCPTVPKEQYVVLKKENKSRNIPEDLRKWFSKTDPKGGWKRIDSKGKVIGPCAREPGEPKPKCLSNEKIAALSKKERAAAVAAKRRHDPDPERQGKPINVSNFGKGKISEAMKNLEEKNAPTNPELWSRAKALARSKFDVYPSAYANGWAAKWYKGKGGGWKTVNEETSADRLQGTTSLVIKYLKDTPGQEKKKTVGSRNENILLNRIHKILKEIIK